MASLHKDHRRILKVLAQHQGDFPLNMAQLGKAVNRSQPTLRSQLGFLAGAGMVDVVEKLPLKYVKITSAGRNEASRMEAS